MDKVNDLSMESGIDSGQEEVPEPIHLRFIYEAYEKGAFNADVRKAFIDWIKTEADEARRTMGNGASNSPEVLHWIFLTTALLRNSPATTLRTRQDEEFSNNYGAWIQAAEDSAGKSPDMEAPLWLRIKVAFTYLALGLIDEARNELATARYNALGHMQSYPESMVYDYVDGVMERFGWADARPEMESYDG